MMLQLKLMQRCRSLVGSLIYLANTRPDIFYPASLILRFMHDPSKLHYAATKRILQYLQSKKKLGIKYAKEKENKLFGTNSDWAGSVDDRKSTSGYVFCLGSKIISWASKKQKTISLSSAKAEYIAATDAICEAIWLRRILSDVQQKTRHSHNNILRQYADYSNEEKSNPSSKVKAY